jgi:hypothetical protein
MMDDATVIALFVVNVIGIAGVWVGVNKLDVKMDNFIERITVCECAIGIKGKVTGEGK